MSSKAIDELIGELCRLPGLGTRSARRIAYYLLNRPKNDVTALIDAFQNFIDKIKICSTCFNVSESDPCPICANINRNHSVICVVEEPQDLASIEATEAYDGVYHILGGVLNPLDGIGPDRLHISELVGRIESTGVQETIIALNPTPEGDMTASFIAKKLSSFDVSITTLAQGISAGSDLEFAAKKTIRQALENRRKMVNE